MPIDESPATFRAGSVSAPRRRDGRAAGGYDRSLGSDEVRVQRLAAVMKLDSGIWPVSCEPFGYPPRVGSLGAGAFDDRDDLVGIRDEPVEKPAGGLRHRPGDYLDAGARQTDPVARLDRRPALGLARPHGSGDLAGDDSAGGSLHELGVLVVLASGS